MGENNTKRKKLSRRDFLKGGALAGAGLALSKYLAGGSTEVPGSLAQEGTPTQASYLPYASRQSTPTATATPTATPTTEPGTGPKVVHIHSTGATSWNFGDDYYGDDVNQGKVNDMVDRGGIELTGASSVAEAWRGLIPNYQPGKAIAIKANFNNCWYCNMCTDNCDDWELKTDALIHPINAVIRGLLQAYPDFDTSDIWIYDATVGDNPPSSGRQIPQRFIDGCLYSGVRFFDQGCNAEAGYTTSDPSANITWRNPAGIPAPPARKVTDVLVNATYLINMPIMKKHGGTEVTLSFKNHAGSISNFRPFHDWTYHDGSSYSSGYNPLVDIYRNPHIQNKTVLTIADGLFGNWKRNDLKSEPWLTFGNQAANSLLFSTDVVAIDCVMCDLLNAESIQQGMASLRNMADDYLVLAADAGLGIYERGDPWGSGYNQIGYERIEL